MRTLFTRETVAQLLMVLAILLAAFGAGLYNVGAGFIVAGVGTGIFSYLLGAE